MPWTPKQFKERHNKKMSLAQAAKASERANAMLRAGVPEGEAIAVANSHAKKQGKLAGMVKK